MFATFHVRAIGQCIVVELCMTIFMQLCMTIFMQLCMTIFMTMLLDEIRCNQLLFSKQVSLRTCALLSVDATTLEVMQIAGGNNSIG